MRHKTVRSIFVLVAYLFSANCDCWMLQSLQVDFNLFNLQRVAFNVDNGPKDNNKTNDKAKQNEQEPRNNNIGLATLLCGPS